MPPRSLTSSVLIWPTHQQVVEALHLWAREALEQQPQLLGIGYFGSYARGDWGVGSDLDVLLIVSESSDPFERRASRWDLSTLPVPTDVLVYTPQEWEQITVQPGFGTRLKREVVWVLWRSPSP